MCHVASRLSPLTLRANVYLVPTQEEKGHALLSNIHLVHIFQENKRRIKRPLSIKRWYSDRAVCEREQWVTTRVIIFQSTHAKQDDRQIREDVAPAVPSGLQVVPPRLQVSIRGKRRYRWRSCVAGGAAAAAVDSHATPGPPYHGVLRDVCSSHHTTRAVMSLYLAFILKKRECRLEINLCYA